MGVLFNFRTSYKATRPKLLYYDQIFYRTTRTNP